MKIFNVNVYGIKESLIASGYPMISGEIRDMNYPEIGIQITDKDMTRATKLMNAKPGSGHDCAAKGIIVQFDITYPNYWTPQFQRYHFADIVSSTSKMHRITKMNIRDCCNKYVDDVVIDNLNNWIDIYNGFVDGDDYVYTAKGSNRILSYGTESLDPELLRHVDKYSKYEVYMKIVSNIPMGLEQTMRVTTNYLQLKTIYQQRRHHKLKEDWGTFCDWVEGLPYFKELCLGGVK